MSAWCLALLAGTVAAGGLLRAAELGAEEDLPGDWSFEEPSPESLFPSTTEPGLRSRALPTAQPDPSEETDFPLGEGLRRLNQPVYSTLLEARAPGRGAAAVPQPFFRPAITYLPPVGIRPREFRPGLFEIYPWIGISQSFETNVQLTSTDPIADFYVTPRAGLEFQLGSPDSIYSEGYDTILALNGLYEAYGDIFYENPQLSAFNQRLELNGRIGRSSAIWRPFVTASDLTGSNLLMAELVNRARRVRVYTGTNASYEFSKVTGLNQSLTYFLLNHPTDGYINYAVWRAFHELTYLVLPETRALLWGEYRFTQPDQGSSGGEVMGGIGWAGKPDPRLYTEIRVGWDSLFLQGDVPGRLNLSGVRFNGYTTFDWSPRFRPTLRYDRDYVFNEVDENDNYVSTLLQVRGEFFLGGNWYITPYLGFSLQEYETSGRITVQYRPELEVSYAFADALEGNEKNAFVKVGYTRSQNVQGEGDPVENFRVSLGVNWKF